jgi:hypothetical protein
MTTDESNLDQLLQDLPAFELPPIIRERALRLARGHLPSAPDGTSPRLIARMAAGAIPGALVSADVVFLLDACAKISRAFGG